MHVVVYMRAAYCVLPQYPLHETSVAPVTAECQVTEIQYYYHGSAQPQSYSPTRLSSYNSSELAAYRSASRDLVSFLDRHSTTACTFDKVRPGLQPSTWQTCGPHPSPSSLLSRSYSTLITREAFFTRRILLLFDVESLQDTIALLTKFFLRGGGLQQSPIAACHPPIFRPFGIGVTTLQAVLVPLLESRSLPWTARKPGQ